MTDEERGEFLKGEADRLAKATDLSHVTIIASRGKSPMYMTISTGADILVLGDMLEEALETIEHIALTGALPKGASGDTPILRRLEKPEGSA